MPIVAVKVLATPKQIDLTSFLLLQLPYCVSMLLLTSTCKSESAQYKCWLLIGVYMKTFKKNMLLKRLN